MKAWKMDRIFFDANFIVGIFFSDDSLHSSAKLLGKKLKKQHYQRVISSLITNEVLTVLRRRAPEMIIKKVCHIMFDSGLETIQQSAVLDEFAKELFLKHAEDKISFTDASILALMQYEHISTLVTFDRNLAKVAKKYGITVLN